MDAQDAHGLLASDGIGEIMLDLLDLMEVLLPAAERALELLLVVCLPTWCAAAATNAALAPAPPPHPLHTHTTRARAHTHENTNTRTHPRTRTHPQCAQREGKRQGRRVWCVRRCGKGRVGWRGGGECAVGCCMSVRWGAGALKQLNKESLVSKGRRAQANADAEEQREEEESNGAHAASPTC